MLLLTPFAALAFDALANLFLFTVLASDCEDCGLDNLGLVLFGGVVLAIGVGVVFTLVRLRWKNKKTESPSFISIVAPK
ncbi:MAG: hypothetical protein QOD75_2329 [Blastocatellia bacterium]|jgi:hypothetical protein|nr:hypothetical protein [Blastocatellia bacterium]